MARDRPPGPTDLHPSSRSRRERRLYLEHLRAASRARRRTRTRSATCWASPEQGLAGMVNGGMRERGIVDPNWIPSAQKVSQVQTLSSKNSPQSVMLTQSNPTPSTDRSPVPNSPPRSRERGGLVRRRRRRDYFFQLAAVAWIRGCVHIFTSSKLPGITPHWLICRSLLMGFTE
jgi:hypothetical protein